MTDKEIIIALEMSNPLRNVPKDMREQFPYSELKEAYNRAIEALEKLSKIEKIVEEDLGDKYAYDEILKVLEGEEE